MSDPKNTIANIVAIISTAIAVLQAAVMAYTGWFATATAAPTVMEYIQLVILIAVAVVGALTGRNANLTVKTPAQLNAQEQASPK